MGLLASISNKLDNINKKLDEDNKRTFEEKVENSPFRKSNMNLHYSDEQRIRFNRAKSGNLYAAHIGKWTHTGKFKSQKDYKTIYETSLESCTCPDYQERKKPCKHMYYLAIEFGIMDKDIDLSGVPAFILHNFDDMILGQDEFRKLLIENAATINTTYNLSQAKSNGYLPKNYEISKHDAMTLKRTYGIEDCIKHGFLVEYAFEDEYEHDFYFEDIIDKNYSKNDIIATLVTSGSSYAPNSKSLKRDMIQWIINNDEKVLEKLTRKYIKVEFSPDIIPYLLYIYRYFCIDKIYLYE